MNFTLFVGTLGVHLSWIWHTWKKSQFRLRSLIDRDRREARLWLFIGGSDSSEDENQAAASSSSPTSQGKQQKRSHRADKASSNKRSKNKPPAPESSSEDSNDDSEDESDNDSSCVYASSDSSNNNRGVDVKKEVESSSGEERDSSSNEDEDTGAESSDSDVKYVSSRSSSSSSSVSKGKSKRKPDDPKGKAKAMPKPKTKANKPKDKPKVTMINLEMHWIQNHGKLVAGVAKESYGSSCSFVLNQRCKSKYHDKSLIAQFGLNFHRGDSSPESLYEATFMDKKFFRKDKNPGSILTIDSSGIAKFGLDRKSNLKKWTADLTSIGAFIATHHCQATYVISSSDASSDDVPSRSSGKKKARK